MPKSRIYKGLQRRGDTKIRSTIKIRQSGVMQIRVHGGTFTDVDGNKYILSKPKIIDLMPDTNNAVSLIHNPTTDEVAVWHRTDPYESPPAGFREIQILIGWGWLVIPAGATMLPEFYVFTWVDNIPMRRIKGRLQFRHKGKWIEELDHEKEVKV